MTKKTDKTPTARGICRNCSRTDLPRYEGLIVLVGQASIDRHLKLGHGIEMIPSVFGTEADRQDAARQHATIHGRCTLCGLPVHANGLCEYHHNEKAATEDIARVKATDRCQRVNAQLLAALRIAHDELLNCESPHQRTIYTACQDIKAAIRAAESVK